MFEDAFFTEFQDNVTGKTGMNPEMPSKVTSRALSALWTVLPKAILQLLLYVTMVAWCETFLATHEELIILFGHLYSEENTRVEQKINSVEACTMLHFNAEGLFWEGCSVCIRCTVCNHANDEEALKENSSCHGLSTNMLTDCFMCLLVLYMWVLSVLVLYAVHPSCTSYVLAVEWIYSCPLVPDSPSFSWSCSCLSADTNAVLVFRNLRSVSLGQKVPWMCIKSVFVHIL